MVILMQNFCQVRDDELSIDTHLYKEGSIRNGYSDAEFLPRVPSRDYVHVFYAGIWHGCLHHTHHLKQENGFLVTWLVWKLY